jgi:hypothetical protein
MSPSLRRTGLGLTLVYYGIITALLSVLFAMFGGMAAGAGGPGAGVVVVGVATAGFLAAAVLMFVGPFFCLAVPEESGAKGLIVGCVVFQLANVALPIIYQTAPDLLPQAAIGVLNLLGFVGAVLFILFMKKLSEFIGRYDLAARAKSILVIWGVLIGILVVMIGALVAKILWAMVLVFVAIILALVAFVRYATLINALRHTLSKK